MTQESALPEPLVDEEDLDGEGEDFDEEDEYDYDSYANLEERKGFIAIWLNVFYEEDNEVIGWYDHDFMECGTKHSTSLHDLFSGYSYSARWIDAAIEACHRIGVTEAEYCFMLYDHYYDRKPGRVAPNHGPWPKAYFIGNIPESTP